MYAPKFIDELITLAAVYRENGDPCGAEVIRKAARMLDDNRCIHCKAEYVRGYSNGYRIGYKRGSEEWQEGLRSGPSGAELREK